MIYDKAGNAADFRYLYVNPAFAKLTGLPVEQVVGRTAREVIPKIEPFWIKTYGRVVRNGKSEHFENKVASIGKMFEIKVWPWREGCFAVIFEDVTARKKEEEIQQFKNKELERLSNSQEETRKAMLNVMEDLENAKAVIEIEKAKDEAMLASIGEGLIAVDSNRRVIIINKAAEEMLGWKAEEIMGKVIN